MSNQKSINFVKMQGLGNDFIIVDAREQNLEGLELETLARNICDRHFGVGADGFILVLPSEKAEVRMRIFNPDGSEAEMSGNGIRCFAKYIYDTSKEKKEIVSVETLAGIILPAIMLEKGGVAAIEVDMGVPRLKALEIPMTQIPNPNQEVINQDLEINGQTFKITAVSMGNPHVVIFVDDLSRVKVDKIGPKIENHPAFPQRTNVEFVKVQSDHELKVQVWERGVGETLSCGTGACATVVAGTLNGKTKRRCIVRLPGGNLDIEWGEEDNHVIMRGPAETVCEGRYYL